MSKISVGSIEAGKSVAAEHFSKLKEKDREKFKSPEEYAWMYLIPLALNRLKAIRKDYRKSKKGKVRLGRPESEAGKARGG